MAASHTVRSKPPEHPAVCAVVCTAVHVFESRDRRIPAACISGELVSAGHRDDPPLQVVKYKPDLLIVPVIPRILIVAALIKIVAQGEIRGIPGSLIRVQHHIPKNRMRPNRSHTAMVCIIPVQLRLRVIAMGLERLHRFIGGAARIGARRINRRQKNGCQNKREQQCEDSLGEVSATCHITPSFVRSINNSYKNLRFDSAPLTASPVPASAGRAAACSRPSRPAQKHPRRTPARRA